MRNILQVFEAIRQPMFCSHLGYMAFHASSEEHYSSLKLLYSTQVVEFKNFEFEHIAARSAVFNGFHLWNNALDWNCMWISERVYAAATYGRFRANLGKSNWTSKISRSIEWCANSGGVMCNASDGLDRSSLYCCYHGRSHLYRSNFDKICHMTKQSVSTKLASLLQGCMSRNELIANIW